MESACQFDIFLILLHLSQDMESRFLLLCIAFEQSHKS